MYADPIGSLLWKGKADDWERERVIGCVSLLAKYAHGGLLRVKKANPVSVK
jgi:hypothetical protein